MFLRKVLTCSAVVLGAVLAFDAGAQPSPEPPPPASVPSVLRTRDPAAPGPGRSRESFAVITKRAKAPGATPVPDGGAAGSGEPYTNVNVKGLTGTLNKADVHQAMETRQALFDACILESRRTVRWLSGSIKYAFKVAADGRVAQLRPLTSTLGHRALEQCLTAAVAHTQFPSPSGRASAEFNWGMSVEPLSQRAFDKASPKLVQRLARKQAKAIFDICEIRRRRARFRVTAYIGVGGRVLSSGAVPLPAAADDKVDCVLEQLEKWHMPKLKRAGKITFDLR